MQFWAHVLFTYICSSIVCLRQGTVGVGLLSRQVMVILYTTVYAKSLKEDEYVITSIDQIHISTVRMRENGSDLSVTHGSLVPWAVAEA